ncbi:hypothetical protein EG329_001873 [Mollisiaceae sp. DMI_Dod_QoI]|nr:hypothetical protein EG329_001873 [Helotiales sp. DMI_Dod_QoI]
MQLQSILFYGLLAFPFAQAQFTLTSEGCVDPSGFDTCMGSVTTTVQQCVSKNCQDGTCDNYNNCESSDANCYSACICGGYQNWINCAVGHCWNRGYSCEFQNYIIDAVQQCDALLTIEYPPYFPAPAGQPGGCSCQIGVIFGIVQEMQGDINKCNTKGTGAAQNTDCYCCGASKALSAFTDVCPDSDLTPIESIYTGMDNFNAAISTLNSTACVKAFANGLDCTASNLGFQQYNNSQFYAWSDLPDFGNDAVTDLPGQLAAPLASTTTWEFFKGGVAATAIAATGSGSVVANSGSASPPSSSAAGSASGSNSGATSTGANTPAGTGTGAGTTTASASTTPTKASNGGSRSSGQISLFAAVGWFAMFALFSF